VNYEQARALGPDSDAPGKWNWSTRRDDHIWTSAPCDWPDYVRPPFDVVKLEYTGWAPTGRERCDHDTQEEAERHHWEHESASLDWREIDQKMTRTLQRCDFPECPNWSAFTAYGGGWVRGTFCWDHANTEQYRLARPFEPGLQEVHS